jgi:hypothetical protein
MLGLAAGSEGWSFAWAAESDLVASIRAPRTFRRIAHRRLLGLAGAIAQGLFRNPLADPYLLGSAAGAGLGVVLVLAAGGLLGEVIGLATAGPAAAHRSGGGGLCRRAGRCGLDPGAGARGGAAAGAAAGWRGGGRAAGAVSDLVTLASPEALRGKQIFMLGTTGPSWAGPAWPAGHRAGRHAAAGHALRTRAGRPGAGRSQRRQPGPAAAALAPAAGGADGAWPPAPRWRRPAWWPLWAWWRRTSCAAWWWPRTPRCWRCRRGHGRGAAAGGRRGRAQRHRAAGTARGPADGRAGRRSTCWPVAAAGSG